MTNVVSFEAFVGEAEDPPPCVDEHVANYWVEHYAIGVGDCTLCGNCGVIDGRAGRVNYCICPNGQIMRNHGADLDETA